MPRTPRRSTRPRDSRPGRRSRFRRGNRRSRRAYRERSAETGRRRPLRVLHSRAMEHPITLVVNDDLQRSRLTVFFRGLLAIVPFIWLMLWGIAAVVAHIIAWFAALFTKRVPL